MKSIKYFLLIVTLIVTITSFISISPQKIKVITIGTQTWTAENLNVSTFRNGDSIPQAKTDKEWGDYTYSGKPAWCYYDNDPKNGAIYGKLYNLAAVKDPRGLAPKGWHVPSENEWQILINFLGGRENACRKLKSLNYWPETFKGTNESGFGALPSGKRFTSYGPFYDLGVSAYYWSSTYFKPSNYVFVKIGQQTMGGGNEDFHGLSVRCIKD